MKLEPTIKIPFSGDEVLVALVKAYESRFAQAGFTFGHDVWCDIEKTSNGPIFWVYGEEK